MITDLMTTLSAACVALALTGVFLSYRLSVPARDWASGVFLIFAGLCAAPLIARFWGEGGVYYWPLLLPLLLSVPPAVYLYARARMGQSDWRRRDALHAMLPGLGLVVALGVWILPASEREMLLLEGALPAGWGAAALGLAAFGLILIWTVAALGYLGVSLLRLRTYRRRLKDHLSNLEQRQLYWIDAVMVGLAGIWLTLAMALLSDNLAGGLIVSGELVAGLTGLVLLLLLSFAVLPAPSGPDEQAPTPQALAVLEAGKYEKSALTQAQATALRTALEHAMAQDRLYLDPNLSLSRLSRHVRAAPDHVSQTLNVHMQTRFFDFVAHWRIADAKQRLASTDASVLKIALDVGFNARSAFYTAFKRETGQTPTAFRRVAATQV